MDVVHRFGPYKTVRVLGEGRYATVYEGQDRSTNNRVAIKITCKSLIDGTNPEFISNERKVYELLRKNAEYSPHIIKFVDYKEDVDNAFFILEYFDGYTLQRVVYESLNNRQRERLKNSEKKSYLLQIGKALQFLHGLNVFHGDLKPENIIVCKNEVKICDFGCSIISEEKMCPARKLAYSGTPGYAPPEVFEMSEMVSLVDLDTWALACVVYYMYSAEQPFAKENIYKTLQYLRRLEVNYNQFPGYVSSLCERVFKKKPGDRIKLNAVVEGIEKFPE